VEAVSSGVQQQLSQGEAPLRFLLGSVAQAVWETDAAGVVVNDSPSWRAYTGQTLDQWLNYGWLNAIHPDDRGYAERQWREAIAAQRLVNAEFRLRAPDGGWRWTNVRAAPVIAADGSVAGWAGMNIDIDARKHAEAALRESETRYRALFESMDQAYAVVEVIKDDTGTWSDFLFIDANPAFMKHTGMPYPVGKTATELLGTPNPRWAQLYGEVLDSGKPIRVEESEGTLGRTFDLNIFGLDQGNSRVAVLFSDITERKRAERALDESESRLKTLVQGVPQLVWRAVDGGQWTWASPQWTSFTGQEEEDSHGYGWLDPVHPDDRARVREIWASAIERGEFHADYRLCHAEEGRYRWFQTRATPVRNRQGEIVEWLGTSTDIDDLRRLQDRQQILLAELQHRVRNILAITRSMVSRSNDGERSTEEYVHHLLGRIGALARTQVLLTRAVGQPVDLENLIRDELVSQVASEEQFSLQGDDVALSPKAAEVLTLAIHELVTNAIKYGALTRAGGHIRIGWIVEERGSHNWLVLDWKETGVAIVDAAPRRRGFGAELISRRIPYELKGHGSVELKPGGVESRIEFPLIEGESILQTDTGGR
jgi:PAS domain S-box-containing protein